MSAPSDSDRPAPITAPVPAALAPIRVLLLALGGEGGGVLVDWLVRTAIALDHPAQSTSIPGVAQRTGATSYYLEWLPCERSRLDGREPVFCLSPMAGDLDLLVSSELLETARAAERALPDPARTCVISSTSRFLTVAEKMQMADGRADGARLLDAVRAAAGESVLFDMAALAEREGTVVSAVMFGAIVASEVLPIPREAAEAVIRESGRGIEASLRGFAAGFEALESSRATAAASQAFAPVGGEADSDPIARDPGGKVEAGADDTQPVLGVPLPPPVAELARLGVERLVDYQDEAYARDYAQRLRAISEHEAAAGGAPAYAASVSAARFLALWMSYEDVIRVADLKSRRARFHRIRGEVGARKGEPIIVRDFLRPRVDELAAMLPPTMARRLLARAEGHRLRTLSEGLKLGTNSAFG
ncbi:MAG: indolepyruvate oxidoreductase subunit beta family protein, partial [Burkholderiaceae bacterium]